MCGINGIFAYNPSASLPRARELIATREHMHARGPDGFGEWWNADRRLGLGHRRLSILDLSDRGAQPMRSACGRYTVVFNGEIYNYPALRRQIESAGGKFRSDSDTEALLHLYALKGAEMVRELRGMFAFAIWDDELRSLFIARDPYGIKPLYTANDGWTFRFASQVKALLAGGGVSRDPEPAGVVGFHIWGSVPEPFTLYRDIRALPAGHSQIIDAAGPREPQPIASIAEIFAEGAAQPAPAAEVAGRIGMAMRESVAAHLLADVEVGLFLSAGVDSGALLGLMRDAGQQRIRAITLSFAEFRNTAEDEAPLAAEVARLYDAEHIVRVVGESEFRADLPDILGAMDQPSIDGVNGWFVAKAAREAGLKVALSGLGGDEVLAGYPSFFQLPRWAALLRVPAAVPGAGRLFRALATIGGIARDRPKTAGLLDYGGSWEGVYLLRRALFLPFELKTMLDPELLCLGLRRLDPLGRLRAATRPVAVAGLSRVSVLESVQYMRNQLLRDADWAGMAHGIEIRTPLVDVTLARAMSPLIPHLAAGTGKRALGAAPSVPLPGAIVDRAKTGFGVPTGRWLAATAAPAAAGKGAASRAWASEVLARLTGPTTPRQAAEPSAMPLAAE